MTRGHLNVMEHRGWGVILPGEKRYEGAQFSGISVTRWVGVEFPEKTLRVSRFDVVDHAHRGITRADHYWGRQSLFSKKK